MTDRTKKIIDGMNGEQLRKQMSVTTDEEVKQYIESRLERLNRSTAEVEQTDMSDMGGNAW